ncbi:hypothetical protein CN643_01775 [Parageobacillus yumthangensis]|uniref:Uncharacterized protein n=1 Tax=Parageobacillus galactosidasius TaxID=883812 RepID=A0A226QLY8_9BACL|nr:hypothetical protein B1689_08795 [Geobacillus sp. 44C]OXB93541.1 hypothetical protein B9L23_00665 [Parageobacillus galactosidasius]PDM39365.1 hypothetical protein CN643_01775 [Parageobacillus yumthangensis]
MLAISFTYLYNIKCWSLTAMKWKVADTPGRFAMASVQEISMENVYFQNRRRRRENNGKGKNSYPFKSLRSSNS